METYTPDNLLIGNLEHVTRVITIQSPVNTKTVYKRGTVLYKVSEGVYECVELDNGDTPKCILAEDVTVDFPELNGKAVAYFTGAFNANSLWVWYEDPISGFLELQESMDDNNLFIEIPSGKQFNPFKNAALETIEVP